MLKKAFDEFRQFLQPSQMMRVGQFDVTFSSRRRSRGDHLLDVRIEHLIRVDFGAMAEQIEHLDVRLVLLQSGFDRFAVVNPQVVQDQENLCSLCHLAPRRNNIDLPKA